MKYSFTVQGATASEVRERALQTLAELAPDRWGSDNPPDLTMEIDVEPLVVNNGSGKIVLWKGEVKGWLSLPARLVDTSGTDES